MNKQVMNKPKVGDKLFSLNVGNSARNREQVLTPVEVLKVGRKYFTAGEPNKTYTHLQYFIEDWRQNTEYCANSKLYKCEQDYYEEKEIAEISREISEKFKWNSYPKNISLNDLREIRRIINK